ncbi:MAG TPA: hypothetical protein VHE34_26175 [Puia sp.]|uniref:hypothetical protein n=1 Tax=Puia sp. TaxID=2045100 RepID=UPI002C796593|nr:hypothetical protein [Puia sp.]HVU98747.1 hypothetical protein [Puia sp.]
MNFFFRAVLALHVMGIVVMAGTTMIDYLTYKTFWKLADAGDARGLGLIPLMAKYGAFVRAGAVMIILTGLLLSMQEKGLFWGQSWFRIKMALTVVLVLNGMLVGNRQGNQLRDTVSAHVADFARYTMDIRVSMNRFYPMQLILFLLLISISIIATHRG